MSHLPPGLEHAIAVVGMAGRFPGASTLDQYWRNVRDGVESIRRLDIEALIAGGVEADVARAPNFVPASALLAGIDLWDAGFFGFSPRDAAILDPQHRIFLECAWEALEHAGHRPDLFDGAIGVFAGSGVNAYLWQNLMSHPDLVRSVGFFLLRHTGNDKDFLATRVSYCFDLTGPSVNIQTACSTSLVAIHSACQSLLQGECEMALAGGVTLELPQSMGYSWEEGGILSPDGHCRPFDAGAQGTVFGSAAGVVALRRLGDALADGDTVHAVIRGSAINNDGALKVGYLAPSVEGQARAIAVALAMAEVPPETVTYVETHGTGTPVGDPIEVAALTRAFRSETGAKGYCALGSVKANIGHTDTAAGVAGFIKAVLALEHGVIPPMLHFTRPNPIIDFPASPFYVSAQALAWKRASSPRRAAVNSLGVGGTNAHVVLEEAPVQEASGPSRAWQVLPISGRSVSVVLRRSTDLAHHLEEQASTPLEDVAGTLALGRKAYRHRRAIVASTTDEAIEALLTADSVTDVGTSERAVSFLFAGGGAQHPNMARGLFESEATFRAAVEECLTLLAPHVPGDLKAALFPAKGEEQAAARLLERPHIALTALFTIQYAHARLLMSWGVRPSALLGHSMGEYTAACLAGVMSLPDALAVVALRGRLFESVEKGAMTGVPLAVSALESGLPAPLSIAAVNGPELSVLSGPLAAIEKFERELAERGIETRRIHIDVAAHSAMLDGILPEFRAFVRTLHLNAPATRFVSNVSGRWIRPEEATDPEYWVRHLRDTVQFSDGLQCLLGDESAVLLEVGPGRTATTLAKAHPARKPSHEVMSSLPHPDDPMPDVEATVRTVARLWTLGLTVDWQAYYRGERRRRVPLPTYPFERERCWIDLQQPVASRATEPKCARRSDIGEWFHELDWLRTEPLLAPKEIAGRWLIFRDPVGLGDIVAERLRCAGAGVTLVDAGSAYQQTGPDRFTISPASSTEHRTLVGEVLSRGPLAGVVHLWNIGRSASCAREVAFHAPLALVQALGEADARDVDMLFVSSGMQSVAGDDELTHPERAQLLGVVRVTPRELPDLHVRSVDIVPTVSDWQGRRLAEQLVAEAFTRTEDHCVALRGSDRFVQQLRRRSATAAESLLRKNGVYLITGGLGGLGLALAEDLSRNLDARLVLVGRTQPDAHACRTIAAIAKRGTAPLVALADVTDLESMSWAVRDALERFGTLHGVIHAAGVLDDEPLLARTRERSTAVLAPKVSGTEVLDRALAGLSLDFIALYSSISAIAGPPGQVDYAAANAFLDAWAHHRHARDGTPTVALGWSAWRDVGMAAEPALEHPIFNRIRNQRRGRFLAYATFTPGSHWILDEHRMLNGDALIPGTGYLEIVRAARTLSGNGGPQALRDVMFVAPFVVTGNHSRELRVRLEPADAEQEFTIAGRDGAENPWQIHARGRADAPSGRSPRSLPIEEIRARCQRRLTFGDAPLPHAHLDFGPRWSCLKAASFGADEALLELILPEALKADLKDHALHPALMDLATGAAQDLIVGRDPARDFYVPVSIAAVEMLRPLPARIFSHVRHRTEAGAGHDIAVFDATICDEHGRELVDVRELVMMRLTDQSLAGGAGRAVHDMPDAPQAPDFADAITTAEGVAAFRRVLTRLAPRHVIVSPHDPSRLIDSLNGAARPRPVAARPEQPPVPDVRPVEEALCAHTAIREAAVIAHVERDGSARIVAFVVPDPDEAATVTELRRFLRTRLANALVPGSFVEMQALPRRQDGSVDYAALPDPFARTSTHDEPRSPTECRVAQVWRELLGIERIGLHDNFLDIGGHSLIGVRALLRIEREIGVRLHPNVLTLQTLQQIAAECDRHANGTAQRTVP